MRRAELLAELDRLGSRPVPLPDPRRVDELEQRIYRDFVVTPPPSGRTNVLTIRRRRRQVLVAGLGLAAAASAAAMIMNRDVSHGFELQAATGAVALFPDGESRAVHSGDEIPAGGLIQTGPAGAVTIEGTTIGSDQVVLVSEAGLTLLPAPATPPEVQVEPPATPAPSSAPATAPLLPARPRRRRRSRRRPATCPSHRSPTRLRSGRWRSPSARTRAASTWPGPLPTPRPSTGTS